MPNTKTVKAPAPIMFRVAYGAMTIDNTSAKGNKIYEWQYRNKDGELVTEKRDVYAFIQSSEPIADYKRHLANEGIIDPSQIDEAMFGNENQGMYLDVSNVTNMQDLEAQLTNITARVRAHNAQAQTTSTPTQSAEVTPPKKETTDEPKE